MGDQLYMDGFWPSPKDILEQALRYEPISAALLFSGGHDSVCATHLAYEYFKGKLPITVVHIDTTIGIRRTRRYVDEVAAQFGWPLKVYTPPKDYSWLVRKFGFPGPSFHRVMYNRLKDRCIRQHLKEQGATKENRVALVSGARIFESRRRMGNSKPIKFEKEKMWTAPIVFWQAGDKLKYMKAHGIPHNSVVDIMHMSGECLCGAFAREGEMDEWCSWFPDEPALATIAALQRDVVGMVQRPVWGYAAREAIDIELPDLPMCSHCEAWAERLNK